MLVSGADSALLPVVMLVVHNLSPRIQLALILTCRAGRLLLSRSPRIMLVKPMLKRRHPVVEIIEISVFPYKLGRCTV